MKKHFILSAILIFISAFSFAQTASNTFAFSLQQAIDYALKTQPAVLNAQLDEQIAHKQAQEVFAASLPQINGSVQIQDFVKLPTSLLPAEFFGGTPGTFIPVHFGTQYNASAGFTANQLIVDGQFIVATQATKALMELSQKNTTRTEIETKAAVYKAYYSVLINQKRMELLNANVAMMKKLSDDTKVLHDNGFVEQLDLDRVTVGYNNLITEQDKVKQLINLNVSLLKFQMGMDVNAQLTLTDTLSENMLKADETINTTFNPSSRIEFQMLQTQKSLEMLSIKRFQTQYIPGLYAFGNFSYNAYRTKFDFLGNGSWYHQGIIGVQLAVPIFDGFLKARKIQEGKLNLLKTDNDMLNLQNGMNLEVNAAKVSLSNNIKAMQSQKENMNLAQSVYNEAKKKLGAGINSSLEIVNAETDLKTAQTNYLNALYDAWISKIDLLKATGQLK